MNKILLACGLGDFIAMESFLTSQEKEQVETVYFCTRAQDVVEPFLQLVFPNVQDSITLFSDFTDQNGSLFCIQYKHDLLDKCHLDINMNSIVDCSPIFMSDDVLYKRRSYQGSVFAQTKLCSIDSFGLPERYFTIHPYSDNQLYEWRNMDDSDWVHVTSWLDSQGIMGVVLNKGPTDAPEHPCLIDLTNKTSISEAFEIVKQGQGFAGASSALSVIASKVFGPSRIIVKSHNGLREALRRFYYQPIATNTFITTDLVDINKLTL